MTTRKTLTEDQARHAMEHRELPADVRQASRLVAVILTQGWCPQWAAMRGYLDSLESKGAPDGLDIAIFELIYDRVDYFDEFRDFKEAIWQNYQIPYVRYYVDGSLVGESNYVSKKAFLAYFEGA